LGASLSFSKAQAQVPEGPLQVFISDFDDTLIESTEARKGLFATPYVIFKIAYHDEYLRIFEDEFKALPEQLIISPKDWEKIKLHLGDGNRQTGNLGNGKFSPKEAWARNPRTGELEPFEESFRPAFYMKMNPDSYKFYGPGERENPLLRDLKSALNRSSEGAQEEKWRGIAWPLMKGFLSHPETAKRFLLATARYHRVEEFMEFFEFLKKQGEIKHLPSEIGSSLRAHAPDFNHLMRYGHGTAEKKLEYFERFLDQLSLTPPSAGKNIVHPDGDRLSDLYHTLIIAEDDVRTLKLLVNRFRQRSAASLELSLGRTPIKYVVINTALREERVELAKYTRIPVDPIFVITSSGGTRRLTNLELREELPAIREVMNSYYKYEVKPISFQERKPEVLKLGRQKRISGSTCRALF
jgi:hypothetical protein